MESLIFYLVLHYIVQFESNLILENQFDHYLWLIVNFGIKTEINFRLDFMFRLTDWGTQLFIYLKIILDGLLVDRLH